MKASLIGASTINYDLHERHQAPLLVLLAQTRKTVFITQHIKDRPKRNIKLSLHSKLLKTRTTILMFQANSPCFSRTTIILSMSLTL